MWTELNLRNLETGVGYRCVIGMRISVDQKSICLCALTQALNSDLQPEPTLIEYMHARMEVSYEKGSISTQDILHSSRLV
jgi:hypothetical protein